MREMKNSVTLMGNLGSDVQLTTLSSGTKVARVAVATNEYRRDQEGNVQRHTQWHNLVGWGSRAESMAEYLTKGMYVLIQGKLTHRSYEDKEGNTRYLSEVVVNNFNRLQKKAS
ncbi:MAG: single-stranded DNA-binding protein [Saprospiraceae bacterium]|nr:single-stranded DNA-binding protein [Saprospiraceae bacterium]